VEREGNTGHCRALSSHTKEVFMKKLLKTQQFCEQTYIDDKINKIKNGERPTVDVVEISDWLVIINGHHTLEAYEQLDQLPEINILSKQEIKNLYGSEAFVDDDCTKINEDYFLYLEQ
jgi:hypothetical protein